MTDTKCTSIAEINQICQTVRSTFTTQKTIPLSYRLEQLRNIFYALSDNEKEIFEAIQADFHKAPFETLVTELGVALSELSYVINNLESWAKDEHRSSDMIWMAMKPKIRKQPYGCVLIIV